MEINPWKLSPKKDKHRLNQVRKNENDKICLR